MGRHDRGAVLIRGEERPARIRDLPEDKRTIARRATGICAEMANHKPEDAGLELPPKP